NSLDFLKARNPESLPAAISPPTLPSTRWPSHLRPTVYMPLHPFPPSCCVSIKTSPPCRNRSVTPGERVKPPDGHTCDERQRAAAADSFQPGQAKGDQRGGGGAVVGAFGASGAAALETLQPEGGRGVDSRPSGEKGQCLPGDVACQGSGALPPEVRRLQCVAH